MHRISGLILYRVSDWNSDISARDPGESGQVPDANVFDAQLGLLLEDYKLARSCPSLFVNCEFFTASEELLDKKKRRSFVKPLPASSKSALSIVGNRLGLAAQPATKAPGRNAKSMVLVRSSSVPKPVELRLFSVAQLPN